MCVKEDTQRGSLKQCHIVSQTGNSNRISGTSDCNGEDFFPPDF